MSIPHVMLPPNLTIPQYEHLLAHLDAFRADKGEDIIEYFSNLAHEPRYHDLYERVCDDLGLDPVASYQPKHRAEG